MSEDTDQLLDRIQAGERGATDALMRRHRTRLKRMISTRLDRRLAPRIDPSDVVQETLADAAAKLDSYLEHRPLPFYPWLRQLAWNRLTDLYRAHVQRERRSVKREVNFDFALSDESLLGLARQFMASGTSPSQHVLRKEMRDRVRSALESLPPHYREVLIMRHLEQLSIHEIAAIVNISEGTVKSRLSRGLILLSQRLEEQR